jgi:hypothetical protein
MEHLSSLRSITHTLDVQSRSLALSPPPQTHEGPPPAVPVTRCVYVIPPPTSLPSAVRVGQHLDHFVLFALGTGLFPQDAWFSA